MTVLKIKLPFKVKHPILALGSQGKNTVCFAKGDSAEISALHDDLSNPGDLLKFERKARFFIKRGARIIAHDLHPEYASTKFASRFGGGGYRLAAIQHHHAHIASCMAENGLVNKKVIGVAFDGTGLGSDGSLWGAEFLVCDYKGFKRRVHLKEIALLGGEKAILEPWRPGALWLHIIYKDKFPGLDIGFTQKLDKKKWALLKKLYASGFNPVLASSMGRLFDAAAAVISGKLKVGFEAELAIWLEKACAGCKESLKGYGFRVIKKGGGYIIDPAGIFKGIVTDLLRGCPNRDIAYRFHLAAAGMVREACILLRKEGRLNRVVLSGGVFQNKVLLGLVLGLLYGEGFEVFTHKKLSCNDSCVSLGQAAIANFRS